MKDLLNKLAEASGWTIPQDHLAELEGMYKATLNDTRALREYDVAEYGPAILYKAEEC